MRAGADGVLRLDWSPLLPRLADETRPPAERAAHFHASLAHAIVDIALVVQSVEEFEAIGLTGGVFQNALLAEAATAGLARHGLAAHLPEMLPMGDGGLAAGQIADAAALEAGE